MKSNFTLLFLPLSQLFKRSLWEKKIGILPLDNHRHRKYGFPLVYLFKLLFEIVIFEFYYESYECCDAVIYFTNEIYISQAFNIRLYITPLDDIYVIERLLDQKLTNLTINKSKLSLRSFNEIHGRDFYLMKR
ncbi:hypothetical protein BLOT_003487 [Blomia tropicalis]|nr:hypothetical protein BLOT_003487 [Blomia tropicalis]